MTGNQLPIRSFSAIPNQAMSKPSTAVTRTWPVPASAVTASVFPFDQRCAREARTNGSQCVGMAA